MTDSSTWLEEITGEKDYGLNPQVQLGSRVPLAKQLLAEILNTLDTLRSENKKLIEERDYWRQQAQGDERQEQLQVMALLESCKVEA